MLVPGVAGLVVPTAVAYTHLPRSAKTGPRLVDSLGGLLGAHPLGSVVGLQQMRLVEQKSLAYWHLLQWGQHPLQGAPSPCHPEVPQEWHQSGAQEGPLRNHQGGPPRQKSWIIQKEYGSLIYVADSCEELRKAEALDSHCHQVTLCSERELEIIVNFIKPGDRFLEGSTRNRGWGRLGGCHWFGSRLGLGGFGAVLGGRFFGGAGLNLSLWRWGFCWMWCWGSSRGGRLGCSISSSHNSSSSCSKRRARWEGRGFGIAWGQCGCSGTLGRGLQQ